MAKKFQACGAMPSGAGSSATIATAANGANILADFI